MANNQINLWKKYNGKGFSAEHADYAEKATADEYGNAIHETYATKAEVSEAIADAHTHSNKAILDATAASYIQNKPSIPSGDQLLPPASASDDGKVLKVNSVGHPIWVSESSLNLIAGTGITITETAQGLVISLA